LHILVDKIVGIVTPKRTDYGGRNQAARDSRADQKQGILGLLIEAQQVWACPVCCFRLQALACKELLYQSAGSI
jgi:hypothetical protein